jgi:hypothetical protein
MNIQNIPPKMYVFKRFWTNQANKLERVSGSKYCLPNI